MVLIRQVITTTLNYPAAVGEARNVEPHEEGLDPGKAGEHCILQSVSRTLSIRPNRFSYKPILKMPTSKDEFRLIDEDGPSLPDLAPDTTQGAVYRFLLEHADQAFRQREIVDAVDVPEGSVGRASRRRHSRRHRRRCRHVVAGISMIGIFVGAIAVRDLNTAAPRFRFDHLPDERITVPLAKLLMKRLWFVRSDEF